MGIANIALAIDTVAHGISLYYILVPIQIRVE